MPGHISPDVDSEEEEGDFGPPDPHDVGDDEGDGGCAAGSSRTSPTDPLERFIQELDDLASMDGRAIMALTFRLRWLICQCRREGMYPPCLCKRQ